MSSPAFVPGIGKEVTVTTSWQQIGTIRALRCPVTVAGYLDVRYRYNSTATVQLYFPEAGLVIEAGEIGEVKYPGSGAVAFQDNKIVALT